MAKIIDGKKIFSGNQKRIKEQKLQHMRHRGKNVHLLCRSVGADPASSSICQENKKRKPVVIFLI